MSTVPAATSPPASRPAAGGEQDAEQEEGRERERGQWEQLSRLVPYLRRHRTLVALTFGVTLLLAVIDVPVPFMLKHLIDATLSHRHGVPFLGQSVPPEQFLLGIFAVLAGLALAKGGLVYTQRIASETIGQRVVFEMRLDLYRHLQSLSMRWFREARTGKLMLRLIGDINAVLDMITDGYLRAFMDGVTVLAVVTAIFIVNWHLALIVLAAMPIYVAAFIGLNARLRRSGRAARRERSRLSGHLQERIAGAAVVKAFVQEEAESGRVEHRTGRLRDRLIERARWGGLLSGVANTTVALGAALVLWIGGREVLAGTMSKGSLMAFYTLSAMLFPPLRRLAKTNETYQASRVSLDRIFDFFDDTTPYQERVEGPPLVIKRGDVAFENVSFAYVPGHPVLDRVSLQICAGETVALVGANGAGKTTLLHHLLRFLAPDSGRIVVDGQDIQHVDLRSLRRQIGCVPQETIVFSGSVIDNIRYGRPDATNKEARDAARVANAYDFIRALPDGFRTEVGERGQCLSGGQLQRVALARTVLADPRILVLDEATSAVDAESEALIQEALNRITRGRTTFIIAHRMSTVRRADRIIVMDHGRIVEVGRHDELLARDGIYRRLFADQLFDVPAPTEARA